MKHWIITLALALSCAAAPPHLAVVARKNVDAPSGSYLLSYGFEDEGDPGGNWTDNGTVEWDDDATPAPLVGDYSLRCTTSSSVSNVEYNLGSGYGDLYLYCIIHPVSLDTFEDILSIETSGEVKLASIRWASSGDGYIQLLSGGKTSSSPGSTFSIGNTYHVWLEYEAGSGATSGARLYISSTSTKPSATLTVTAGDETADAQILRLHDFGSTTSFSTIFDELRVSETAIGDSPE